MAASSSNNAIAAASGAAADASNCATAAASGASDASALEIDVAEILSSHRKRSANLTWKRLLAGHLNRGKKNGGAIIDGFVEDHMTYDERHEDRAPFRATLQIPHSFERGDNAACGATVEAELFDEGIQLASKMVLAKLFIRDATNHPAESRLTLHSVNWKVELADLLQEVRNTVRPQSSPQSFYRRQPAAPPSPPLPMPTTSRSSHSRAAARYESPDDPAQRVEEIKRVLRNMILTDGGETKPHRARRIQLGDGEAHMPGLVLARLVKPGKLLAFLTTHGGDEFEFTTEEKDGQQRLRTISFRRPQRQPAAPRTEPPPVAAAHVAPPTRGSFYGGGYDDWQPAAPAAHAAPAMNPLTSSSSSSSGGYDGRPAAPAAHAAESDERDSCDIDHVRL